MRKFKPNGGACLKRKGFEMTEEETQTTLPATHISNEDLKIIQELRAGVYYMRILAEKAQSELRNAELALQNLTLRTYMKYGISPDDGIDHEGRICRFAPSAPSVEIKEEK